MPKHEWLLLTAVGRFCPQCVPGKYGTVEECIDCPKGGYCEGGVYTGPNTPMMKECPANMTTLGVRASSIDACGEDPRQALLAATPWCAVSL